MQKLPLRPLLFVPAYLLVHVISVVPTVLGLEFAEVFAVLLGLGGFALHFTWTYRALAFVSKRLHSMRYSGGIPDPLWTARRILLMLILFLGGVVLYKGYLQPAIFSGTPIDQTIEWFLAVGGALLFFSFFWIAARAVCEAEMGSKVPAHSIIGTFLLFIYIVIGAPFIYRRLKNLGDQPSGGFSEPD